MACGRTRVVSHVTCYNSPIRYIRCILDDLASAPVARQPLTAVTEAAPLGVDPNDKSAHNAQRFQLPAIAPHHLELLSRGGHEAFVRSSDVCADAEVSLAGPYPSNACRPPSAPCGVGAGPTSWPAIPTRQLPDGHALPPTRTSPTSRPPPRMGARWPIPPLPKGRNSKSSSLTIWLMILRSCRNVVSYHDPRILQT